MNNYFGKRIIFGVPSTFERSRIQLWANDKYSCYINKIPMLPAICYSPYDFTRITITTSIICNCDKFNRIKNIFWKKTKTYLIEKYNNYEYGLVECNKKPWYQFWKD
jgi:hypothetical protein